MRVNAARTDACAADLDAVAEHAYGIRIPKTESPDDVAWVAARAPGLPIICAIESARGVLAAAGDRGGTGRPRTWPWAGWTCSATSTRAAATPRRPTSAATSSSARVRRGSSRRSTACSRGSRDDADCGPQAEFARSLGFSGKSAIHPRQLPVLHEVFTPSERELAWAREVLEAFDAAGGAALRLPDGEFVDLPVAQRASRMPQLADAVPRALAGVR